MITLVFRYCFTCPYLYGGRAIYSTVFFHCLVVFCRYPFGESYLDVVQRLEPVIIELERETESVCVVGHQAILRVVYGYYMGVPLEDVPNLEMPLHTLIELTPQPNGTHVEHRFKVPVEEPFSTLEEIP